MHSCRIIITLTIANVVFSSGRGSQAGGEISNLIIMTNTNAYQKSCSNVVYTIYTPVVSIGSLYINLDATYQLEEFMKTLSTELSTSLIPFIIQDSTGIEPQLMFFPTKYGLNSVGRIEKKLCIQHCISNPTADNYNNYFCDHQLSLGENTIFPSAIQFSYADTNPHNRKSDFNDISTIDSWSFSGINSSNNLKCFEIKQLIPQKQTIKYAVQKTNNSDTNELLRRPSTKPLRSRRQIAVTNRKLELHCASLLSNIHTEKNGRSSLFSIVFGYVILAVVFSVVKIITMNNLDDIGYDYVIYYLTKLLKVGKANHRPVKNTVCCKSLLNINCTTCSHKLDKKPLFTKQPSKFILYGTLRLFSFLLIIAYEGKIYNSGNSNSVDNLSGELVELNELLDEFNIDDDYSENAEIKNKTVEVEGMRKSFFDLKTCISTTENFEAVSSWNGIKGVLNSSLQRRSNNGESYFMSSIPHGKINSFKLRVVKPNFMQILRWIIEPGMAQVWNEPPLSYSLFIDFLSKDGRYEPKPLRLEDYEGLFIVFITLVLLSVLSFVIEYFVAYKQRAGHAIKSAIRNSVYRASNHFRLVTKKPSNNFLNDDLFNYNLV